MNTQAVMKQGQFSQQFAKLMPNVYRYPLELANGRINYGPKPLDRSKFPNLINLSGDRTNIASMFDSAFPRAKENEDAMFPLSSTSTFVSRVKFMDGLMDQKAERVLLGAAGRPHNTFDDMLDMKNFHKFLELYGNDSIRIQTGGRADGPSVADDAIIAAERASVQSPVDAARTFFVAGVLYASQRDATPSSIEAAHDAFTRAGAIYLEDGRYEASAISSELAAKADEMRLDGPSKESRTAASDAWLLAVQSNTKYEEDKEGHLMQIFRGLMNASMAGYGEKMTEFWDAAGDFHRTMGEHLEVAYDRARIVSALAARQMDEGDKDYWIDLLPRIGSVIQALQLVGGQKELIGDLRKLSDEAGAAAAAVGA